MANQTSNTDPGTNRRNALKLMAAGLVGMAALPAAAVAKESYESSGLFAIPNTEEDALSLLMTGNQRYLKQELTSCSANMAELRKHSEAHQEPFAAILSCADSRVPVELVFDQTLGQLFVCRVAGNIATPDTIASLEYAAAAVGVKLILVVGHTNCGAVKAAAANKPVPGQVSTLFQYIHPAVKNTPDLTEASRKNAILQATALREASPVLAELVEGKKLLIRAAIYDVSSGYVTLLDG
jgi:carbonic anhydrase